LALWSIGRHFSKVKKFAARDESVLVPEGPGEGIPGMRFE
jgi:hypothetical protein